MKKYRFLKGIALILVVVMLFSCLPLTAIAGTMDNSTETETEQSQSQNNYNDMIEVPLEESTEDIYILAEDTTKRGEFEKHYLCSDGRFVAVTYPEAVHYQDESGEWADIDNSLSLNSAKGVYEAQNGDFKISFHAPAQSSDTSVASASGAETTAISGGTVTIEPIQTQPESLITLTKGEQTLSWTLTAIKSPSALGGMTAGMMNTEQSASTLSVDSALTLNVMGEIKSNTQTETEFIKKNIKDPDAFALPKISNQVQYDSLFGADEGVSVRYTTYRNKIKEDIIISKETDIESFSMLVNCSGLTPVLNTDGSVDLLDGDGEMVYHVGAPYMYDAVYSICDVEVTLVTKGDICIITYTPDGEWMSSPDREYPIVLDPSVSTSEYTTNVYDTYVASGDTTNHSAEHLLELYGGKVALIGFRNLPVIHSSMPIYKAEVKVNLTYAQLAQTPLQLEMFQYSTSVNDMLYTDYTSDEANDTKSLITTAHAAVGDPSVLFDVSADIHNIYSKQDTTVFALGLAAAYSSYCYPIVSSESTSGNGPSLVIYYGYAFEEEFSDNDLISFQNSGSGRYISVGLGNGTSASTTTSSTGLRLWKNDETGGYQIRSTANTSVYLTVNNTGSLIWSEDYIPEKQEWLFVPASMNTFYIVYRSDMSKLLTMTDVAHPESGEWVITDGNLTHTSIDGYNCPYCDGDHQQWYIYKGENRINADYGMAFLETGIYYIDNAKYGGFLTGADIDGVELLYGNATSFGDEIKWIVTKIGSNEYTFQLYNNPNYFLACNDSGGITFTPSNSGLSDDIRWKVYLSFENNAYYQIYNEVSNGYLYVNGEVVSTANASQAKASKRAWRFFDANEDYTEIKGKVTLTDLYVDIGEATPINSVCSINSEYLLSGDFYYNIMSGDAHSKYIPLYDKFMGMSQGITEVRATHKLTGDVMDFSVVVSGNLSQLKIEKGASYYANQEMMVVADRWSCDNPSVVTVSSADVLNGLTSGYSLVSGYSDENELIALTKVHVVTELDELLENLTTNELYYLYYQGFSGLHSLSIDICEGSSRDLFETKLRLLTALKQWYKGDLGIDWIKSKIYSDFEFSITTDRAQYVTAEYEVKGREGYYNPEMQMANLTEFLNNIKGLIVMYGVSIAKTLYADDFAANMMVTSAEADVQAAYQRHCTVVNAARQAQIAGGYSADDFSVTVLKKGTKIYRVCESAESLHQGAWYTTKADLINCGYDYNSVYSGLQMSPQYKNPYVAEYVVNTDIYVASGRALSNTTYGAGGFTQYYISSWSTNVDYNGILISLGNVPS